MACTPQGTTTSNLGLCKPQAGENNWASAINGNWDIIDSYAPAIRSYLAGLTLSTAGSSTTMTTAAGASTDGTNARMMTLGSSINKTTAAWAVGTGNGGLDTGAIANSTWYHFWLILRSDTGVVDVLISLSATAPTMPANYNFKRRIGAGKTDGGGNWTAFTQDGDLFQWSAPVLDISAGNPGTSAVTRTLASVPTGVNVIAVLNLNVGGSTSNSLGYLSDLATNDVAPATGSAPLFGVNVSTVGLNASGAGGPFQIRTNTSAQIRSRVSASDGNTSVNIATLGWIDRRGRDA